MRDPDCCSFQTPRVISHTLLAIWSLIGGTGIIIPHTESRSCSRHLLPGEPDSARGTKTVVILASYLNYLWAAHYPSPNTDKYKHCYMCEYQPQQNLEPGVPLADYIYAPPIMVDPLMGEPEPPVWCNHKLNVYKNFYSIWYKCTYI